MSQRWFNRHDKAGFEINRDHIIWQTDHISTIVYWAVSTNANHLSQIDNMMYTSAMKKLFLISSKSKVMAKCIIVLHDKDPLFCLNVIST